VNAAATARATAMRGTNVNLFNIMTVDSRSRVYPKCYVPGR
jgi:hypothetical protein